MRSVFLLLFFPLLAGCLQAEAPAGEPEWTLPRPDRDPLDADTPAAMEGSWVVDEVVHGMAWFRQPVVSGAFNMTFFGVRTAPLGEDGFVYVTHTEVQDVPSNIHEMPHWGTTIHRSDQEVYIVDDVGWASDAFATLFVFAEHPTRVQVLHQWPGDGVRAWSPTLEDATFEVRSEAIRADGVVRTLQMDAEEGDEFLALLARDSQCGAASLTYRFQPPSQFEAEPRTMERDETGWGVWPTAIMGPARHAGVAVLEVGYTGVDPALHVALVNLGPEWRDGIEASGEYLNTFHRAVMSPRDDLFVPGRCAP